MGHVGDEILAHLLELIQTGDVTHQQQVLAIAVAGDMELQAAAVVDRRRNLQRVGVVAALEVLLEARIAHQVGHGLTAVLRRLEAQQGLGGAVPPLQVALAVEHHHRILERRGGLLHAVDHRLQAATRLLVAALQVVDAVEHLAPQAVTIGRRLVGFVLAQPLVQAQQLAEGPAQMNRQAHGQHPGIFAGDRAQQQAGASQQQQAAHHGATPVLIHDGAHPCEKSEPAEADLRSRELEPCKAKAGEERSESRATVLLYMSITHYVRPYGAALKCVGR